LSRVPLAVESVLPGVAVVAVPSPTLPPATTTNCWLLGDDAVIAVDPAGATEADREALAAALGSRAIAAILLTHHHIDHVCGALDLQRRTGAPIWAHAHTADVLQLSDARLLDEGDDLGGWRVLHTPGHARGHLCLLSADGETILAGDMVAGEGTIVLDPPEGELGAYLDSLARLRDLAPVRLLPAHGPIVAPAVDELTKLIDHRNARTEQIRVALAQRPAATTPRDLVLDIYPDLPAFIHPVAERQLLCHLQWLAAQGEVHQQAPLTSIGSPSPRSDDAGAQDAVAYRTKRGET
jgi:endoribonuclease LACTB2